MGEEWTSGPVRVAIHASIFGCLGLHQEFQGGDWKVTHRGSGYAFPGHIFGEQPLDWESASAVAEALVTEIPDLDSMLTEVFEGRGTNHRRIEISKKVKSVAIEALKARGA
jgi:hypothetical protein